MPARYDRPKFQEWDIKFVGSNIGNSLIMLQAASNSMTRIFQVDQTAVIRKN